MLSFLAARVHGDHPVRRVCAPRLLTAIVLVATSARANWQDRVFPYDKAEAARQLARKECKPLVLHFVPDDKVGFQQFQWFYTEKYRVPDDVLDKLVIVVIPSGRYAGLKNQLGVKGPGGFRAISAYDLEPFDTKAAQTCRSGFR